MRALSLPEAAPADFGRALSRRRWARDGQGLLGGRGGRHGLGVARAPRPARARGGARRAALGRGARGRRGAAPHVAKRRSPSSSRTRTSSRRRRSTRSSSPPSRRRLRDLGVRRGSALVRARPAGVGGQSGAAPGVTLPALEPTAAAELARRLLTPVRTYAWHAVGVESQSPAYSIAACGSYPA